MRVLGLALVRQSLALLAVLSAGLFQASAAERWIPYTVRSQSEIDWDGISRLGCDVLRTTNTWVIGSSEHFLVFADSRPGVSAAVDEAENARRDIVKWLALDLPPGPQVILAFINEAVWGEMVTRQGLRNDGLALQQGNELYFRDKAGQDHRPDRVAHEVTHVVLNAAFGSHIPLWLEEGLAGYCGWRSAVDVYQSRDMVIFREEPPLNAEDLYTLSHLLAIQHYPGDELAARVFYRQAAELVAALFERLGDADMAVFVHAMCTRHGDPVRIFREASGLASDDEAAIVEKMRAQCLAPRTR